MLTISQQAERERETTWGEVKSSYEPGGPSGRSLSQFL